MKQIRHYTTIVALVLMGGYLIFSHMTGRDSGTMATQPNTPPADQLVEVHGMLTADGKVDGGTRSFELDTLPGATLFFDRERLKPREEQGFLWGMRPGTVIRTHLHRDDLQKYSTGALTFLRAHSLVADVDTLFHLPRPGQPEEQGGGHGMVLGIFCLVAAGIYALVILR
jgi:hypothetical protein